MPSQRSQLDLGDVQIKEGGAFGEVSSNPTANTLLGRLKDLQTGVGLAAGSAAIGKTNINPGAAQLSVAAVNFADSGAHAAIIAAGSGGQTIKIYKMFLIVAGATSLTFVDGVVTDGPIPLGANGAITLDFDGEPWFIGLANTAFGITSTNAVQVSGRIYYVKS